MSGRTSAVPVAALGIWGQKGELDPLVHSLHVGISQELIHLEMNQGVVLVLSSGALQLVTRPWDV